MIALLEKMLMARMPGVPAMNFSDICANLSARGSPDAHGGLALLFLFGLPDESGRLNFPHGVPRDIDRALVHLRAGIEGRCSICFTLLGYLVSLGHPVASMRTHASLGGPGSATVVEEYVFDVRFGYTRQHAFDVAGAYKLDSRTLNMKSVYINDAKSTALVAVGPHVKGWAILPINHLHDILYNGQRNMVALFASAGVQPDEDWKEFIVRTEYLRVTTQWGNNSNGVIGSTEESVSLYVSSSPDSSGDATAETPVPDVVAVAYLLGSKHGNALGTFAYNFNVMHGSIYPNLRHDLSASTSSLWTRQVQHPTNSVCNEQVQTLTPTVLRSTQNAESNNFRDWGHRSLANSSEMMRSKQWGDLLFARSSTHAPSGYAYADLLSSGGDAVPRNMTAAAEYYNKSAKAGFLGGHWGLFLMQLRGQIPETSAHIDAIVHGENYDEHGPLRKAFARYHAHRRGLSGFAKDPVLSGNALREAAELGEVNAQIMMAFAFRGEDEIQAQPLLHGVDVGPQNKSEEIRFLTMASRNGRTSASTHLAIAYLENSEMCLKAYKIFRHVGIAFDPLGSVLFLHARRAYDKGDAIGALLRLLLLSEGGSEIAMKAAVEIIHALPKSAVVAFGDNDNSSQGAGSWVCGGRGWHGCAVAVHRRLITFGNNESLNVLSGALRTGWHGTITKDIDQARQLTREAARRGDPRGLLESAWDELCASGDVDRYGRNSVVARELLLRLEGMTDIGRVVPTLATGLRWASHAPDTVCSIASFGIEHASTTFILAPLATAVIMCTSFNLRRSFRCLGPLSRNSGQ